MKALYALLLVPVLAFAQGRTPTERPPPPPPSIQWADSPDLLPKMRAGWVLGSEGDQCVAIDPQAHKQTFPPRADGKCHVEDVR